MSCQKPGPVPKHCRSLALVATTAVVAFSCIFREGRHSYQHPWRAETTQPPPSLTLFLLSAVTQPRANIQGAWAKGTHVEVMVRKRSCPAVSQICSFTFSPLISTVRILKSTPIVVM